MESQTIPQPIRTKPKANTTLLADYPTEDVVNLRLPRKVIACLDGEVDLTALPKRKPHIVLEMEPEDAE